MPSHKQRIFLPFFLQLLLLSCLFSPLVSAQQTLSLDDLAGSLGAAPPRSGSIPLSMGAELQLINNVPDLSYIRDPQEDIFGDPLPVPEERFTLLNQVFHLEFRLQENVDYSSALKASLGFRNTFRGGDSAPDGSEFTGYRISLRQDFLAGHLQSTLRFGHRRSDFFLLQARHNEAFLRLHYSPVPADLVSESGFNAKLGISMLKAFPIEPDQTDFYDLAWAIEASIKKIWMVRELYPISLSLDAALNRIANYRIGSTVYRGARSISLSPRLDIMLVENLWIGFFAHIALQRPEGNEQAFPDVELPGLYGNSVGLSLKTATF